MSGVKIPDYGMFSKEGNRRVHFIVKASRAINAPWERVNIYLQELAAVGFGEATDTVVREAVYAELFD